MIKLTYICEDLFMSSNAMKPHEKLITKAVIAFMREQLGIKSKIVVRKKSKAGIWGDVILNNNSLNNDKFTLHYSAKLGFPMRVQTMIHELTHVKQISRKELTPSADWKHLMWKNKNIISVKDYNKLGKTASGFKQYKKLPWEKEAYANMKPLYTKFLKSSQWLDLRGKNPTLDYIMDNL